MKAKVSACKALVMTALVSVSACTGEDIAGDGSLRVTVTGGVVMEQGYPYEEPGLEPLLFTDGWSLRFDKFLLALDQIQLREQPPEDAQTDGAMVREWRGPVVIDLMRPPSGVELAMLQDLPATRLDFGYRVVDATEAAENVSASTADFRTLVDNGWTVWFEGEAWKANGRTVPFSVGFSAPTLLRRCVSGTDGTRGVAIPAQSTRNVTIYPHSVHLFWDVLLQGDAQLRFDPWAAAAGADGVVTADDLATQDLLDLRNADGDPLLDPNTGERVTYDDGGLLPDEELTLLGYTIYGFRQSLHFDGLGFCPWTEGT
jgi:hypothetical protein